MTSDLKPASEAFPHRPGLLVIDEAWRVSQAYDLQELIRGRLEAGGSVLVAIMGDEKEPWVDQLCNVEASPEVWRTVIRLANAGGRIRSGSEFRARNEPRAPRPDEPTVAEIQALNGRNIATLNADEKRVYDFYRKQGRKFGVKVLVRLGDLLAGLVPDENLDHGGDIQVTVN